MPIEESIDVIQGTADLRDPRDVDWELDTARNYGRAPYPQPSIYNEDVAVSVTYGNTNVGGIECANVDVYYKDGHVEQRWVPWSDIISGPANATSVSDDEHTGYHNVRASDL